MAKLTDNNTFIKKCIDKHRGLYEYDKTIFKGRSFKIEVKCKIHGYFLCNPYDHLNKSSGCPKCAGTGNYINPLEYFIERANKIHNNFYDYSLFKYKGVKEKSKIICIKHGVFEMHPNNHLNNHGCPECRKEKISEYAKKKNTDKNIIDRCKKTHNDLYKYPKQKISRNYQDKITIVCKIHGEFNQSLMNHLYNGNGCEKCANNRLSKGEKKIEEFLIDNNIEHIREHTFDKCINPKTNKKLPFDFYIPGKNICIEYQGKQHFQDSDFFKMRSGDYKEIQRRDEIKKNYCILNNIKLIVIPYNKFYKINNILKDEI